jgi:hypothetical protein
VGYFDVVVNTPRKLHSAGPTNRDYPNAETKEEAEAALNMIRNSLLNGGL